MSCYHQRLRAYTRLALALVGSVGLWACEDLPNQSPTEPVAETGEAAFKNASKNTLIAFTSERDGGNPEIYVMQEDGKKQTRLTNNTDFDLQPAWSPDRIKIAFTSFPDGGTDGNIFVMSADGTGRTQLTTDPSYEEHPDWSPDGSKIAFDRNGTVVVMNADGSNQVVLPAPMWMTAYDPDWSPDGTKIAFTAGQAGDPENIWIMNADGTGQTQVTNQDAAWPAWSPDGSKIAFNGNKTGPTRVYVVNPDGSNETQLTSTLSGAPAWSPDGSRIAYIDWRSGTNAVYVMNADGSGQTPVATNGFAPAWAR
jgi:Tol biopolymer transport system component